jgi:ubiquinone/menaquinone biosynthesis C-methylase UbiE
MMQQPSAVRPTTLDRLSQCLADKFRRQRRADGPADWLLRRCSRLPQYGLGNDYKLLDYGCGTALMLWVLKRLGYSGSLSGCDVSGGMLEQAKQQWPFDRPPDLRPMKDELAPFDNAEFDLIIVSSVLHHVPVERRDRLPCNTGPVERFRGMYSDYSH